MGKKESRGKKKTEKIFGQEAISLLLNLYYQKKIFCFVMNAHFLKHTIGHRSAGPLCLTKFLGIGSPPALIGKFSAAFLFIPGATGCPAPEKQQRRAWHRCLRQEFVKNKKRR